MPGPLPLVSPLPPHTFITALNTFITCSTQPPTCAPAHLRPLTMYPVNRDLVSPFPVLPGPHVLQPLPLPANPDLVPPLPPPPRPSIPHALQPSPLPLASAPFTRYEVNPDLVPKLEAQGMMFVGRDETGERMEILELSNNPCDHPFFVAAQFHPEFKSRWVSGLVGSVE